MKRILITLSMAAGLFLPQIAVAQDAEKFYEDMVKLRKEVAFKTTRSFPVYNASQTTNNRTRVRGQLQDQTRTTPASITFEERPATDFDKEYKVFSDIRNEVVLAKDFESLSQGLGKIEEDSKKVNEKIVEYGGGFKDLYGVVTDTDPTTPGIQHEGAAESKPVEFLDEYKKAADKLLDGINSEKAAFEKDLQAKVAQMQQQANQENQNALNNQPTPSPSPSMMPMAGMGGGGSGSGGGAGGGSGGGGAGAGGGGSGGGDAAKAAQAAMDSMLAMGKPLPSNIDPSAFNVQRGVASVPQAGLNPITMSNQLPSIPVGSYNSPPAGDANTSSLRFGGASPFTVGGATSVPGALPGLASGFGFPAPNAPGDGGGGAALGGSPNGGNFTGGDPYASLSQDKPYKSVSYDLRKEVAYGSSSGGGEGDDGDGGDGTVDGGGAEGGQSASSDRTKNLYREIIKPVAVEKGGPSSVLGYLGLIRTVCAAPNAKDHVGICARKPKKVASKDTVALLK